MALRASMVPGVGSYLVLPAWRALMAASLMKVGVSKSGSPAPKETTSTPAFLRALALAVTARVMDSAMSLRRLANCMMAPEILLWALFVQRGIVAERGFLGEKRGVYGEDGIERK